MVQKFGDITTDAKTVQVYRQTNVPKDVQRSFLLWLTTLAAGVAETILNIINFDPEASQMILMLIIRLVFTGVLTAIIIQMRRGKNWARITLAILLGGIGTVSLVYDPIDWLIAGNSLREFLQNMDLAFTVFALVRVAHLMAVLTALVFMFRPSANAYFRDAAR